VHFHPYSDIISAMTEPGIPINQTNSNASRTSCDTAELEALRREIAELRRLVREQAGMIAWLNEDNERQERSHNHLRAHIQDQFARAFLWLDAIACKVLPKAVVMASEITGRVERSAGATVPPHRLAQRGTGKGR
jgi:hypothetical protein